MENTYSIVGLDDTQVGNANTSIDNINGDLVNLIFIAIDGSGSMLGYSKDMVQSLDNFKNAILSSKDVDDILIARADFSSAMTIGGYKKVADLDTAYNATGSTVMYDTIIEGKTRLFDYMNYLKNQGVRTKAVFAVFSDGSDNGSRNDAAKAKNAVDEMNSKEITTAFISFGPGATSEATRLGFKNSLNVSSSASELRRAFDVLSKSVISSSRSVVSSANSNFFDVI